MSKKRSKSKQARTKMKIRQEYSARMKRRKVELKAKKAAVPPKAPTSKEEEKET